VDRPLRVLALIALLVLGGGVFLWGSSRLRNANVFVVQDVQVIGNQFLSQEEVIRAAAFSSVANVWDDPQPLIDALVAHPLIQAAQLHRRLPSTVIIEIQETRPVALVPMPTLQPVDEAGRLLPLDPAAHRLDLPILRLRSAATELEDGVPSREIRMLAAEAAHLTDLDPELGAHVSELWLEADGSMGMALLDPAVDIRFRAPLTIAVLDRGLWTLEDALTRGDGAIPLHLDLRFADRVYVRFDGISFRPLP